MIEEGKAAGGIIAGLTIIGGILLKFRSLWSSDSRKIAHDDNHTKWEDGLLAENKELKKRLDAMWQSKVEDKQEIAKLSERVGVLEMALKSANDQVSEFMRKHP